VPSPLLYEINTRCWLHDLTRQQARPITLANVPDPEFDAWRRLGFTHLWLMGVWTVGPKSRAHSLETVRRNQDLHPGLQDWQPADITGSPYAIATCKVPDSLGGDTGLAAFRRRLHQHGIQLVLDFVPNHTGLDHPWLRHHPEYFVQSSNPRPGTFPNQSKHARRWIAHGRDPHFPEWVDTAQLDHRLPATRSAMIAELRGIAGRCDGVRCDMAMLALNDVFAHTWRDWPAPGSPPDGEFWRDAIDAVNRPGFLFLAEVYWGLESRLRELGFDYTYDKSLYDLIVQRRWTEIHARLYSADTESLHGGAYFLENHDEPRIATLLDPAEQRAATLLMLALPGLRLLHEGQLHGARIRIPVEFGQRPAEPLNRELAGWHERLLASLKHSPVGRGQAALLKPERAWPDNPTADTFVVIRWQSHASDFDLVVVNLAPHRAQCRVHVDSPSSTPARWRLRDRLGSEDHLRDARRLATEGLFLDLPAHGAQMFHVTPA
jgi:hypothetical protein